MTVDTGQFEALAEKVDELGQVITGHQSLLIRTLAAYAGVESADLPPRERHLRVVEGEQS